MKHAPVIASSVLCLWLSVDRPARAEAPEPQRVVAVGDLHGDLKQTLATLALAGLVDSDGHWAGGTTTFVQTGDVVDRGPDSKAIIDLLRRLEAEAPTAGGRVMALAGNHEAMNVTGDWRYVDPGDVAVFGSVEARAAAFSLGGEYGGWVASRPIVAKVHDTIFVHGGVTPSWADKGVDGIDAAWKGALRGGDPSVLGTDGPLWYRDYVQEPESRACPRLAEALTALGARRMVVGHTTRRDGKIQTRCAGRLAVIDVGIASHYGGHTGAWELLGDDARAIYPNGTADLPDPAP